MSAGPAFEKAHFVDFSVSTQALPAGSFVEQPGQNTASRPRVCGSIF